MKNKKQFVVGDKVKTLVNGKMWVQGEIIDIQGDIATVALSTFYGKYVDFITVESKMEDLRDIITDIMYFSDKREFMDLRLWD